MTIKKRAIYGLVGENGSGKTTLMRMITGLAKISEGKLELFGYSDKNNLVSSRIRMGALIEEPALHPNLSAKDNLEYHRLVTGVPDKNCIKNVLSLVNIDYKDNKKVKNFSLGMKQRLGIALALLTNPEFLVLDEPINGLDLKSIYELQETLKNLNKERNVTMLISSNHVLSLLSPIATHYGVMHSGRLIYQLTPSEIDKMRNDHFVIKVKDTAKAAIVIEEKLKTDKYKIYPDNHIYLYDFLDSRELVQATFNECKVLYDNIRLEGDDIERFLAKLMGQGIGVRENV